MYSMVYSKKCRCWFNFVQNDKVNQFLVGYCDSDYASNFDTCQLTTGYMFTLAKLSINWKSTVHSCFVYN